MDTSFTSPHNGGRDFLTEIYLVSSPICGPGSNVESIRSHISCARIPLQDFNRLPRIASFGVSSIYIPGDATSRWYSRPIATNKWSSCPRNRSIFSWCLGRRPSGLHFMSSGQVGGAGGRAASACVTDTEVWVMRERRTLWVGRTLRDSSLALPNCNSKHTTHSRRGTIVVEG